jgi:hypothetical protein
MDIQKIYQNYQKGSNINCFLLIFETFFYIIKYNSFIILISLIHSKVKKIKIESLKKI